MKTIRQQQIVDLLTQNGTVVTEDLAAHFNVSVETIRRDFRQLEHLGIATKIYGGAKLVESYTPPVPSFQERQSQLRHVKSALGECVSKYIPDNSILVLGSGTTIYECIPFLAHKTGMTYICMDIHSSAQFLAFGNSTVYLLGGRLTPYGTSSGAFAKEFFNSISVVDILIISADGVDINSGLCDDEENVSALMHKCIKKANKAIALLDHTKFTKRAFFKTCDFADIDILITDSKTPESIIRKLRSMGITVEIVDSFSEDASFMPLSMFKGI